MNVERVIEDLIRVVDQIVPAELAPAERASKHLKMRVEFQRILDRSSGPKHAEILEAILRTINPRINDDEVRKWLREGDWIIYGSEHNEGPHGRFVVVHKVLCDLEDERRRPNEPEMTLKAWMHDDKKDALEKYIEIVKRHSDGSREYLLDLGDYPGDPTTPTRIVPVKTKYVIEECA